MVIPTPNVSIEKLARRTEMLNENDLAMGASIDELLELGREQKATILRHGAALNEYGKVLTSNSALLTEHSTTLAHHGEILEEHTITLARHGELLEELSATLVTHTLLLHNLDDTTRLNAFAITEAKRAIKELNNLQVDHSRKLEDVGRFVSRQDAFNVDVESKLATVMSDVTGLKTKVDGLESKVDGIEAKIDMILTRLPAQ